MPVNDRFALLIKKIEKTSNALSKDIGVTAPTIRKIEKGTTLPSGKILTFLVEKYNVNVNWLLTGKGDMFISEDGGHLLPTDVASSRNATCSIQIESLKKEIKHLNDKLKDKEEIIRLMKNQR